MAGFRLELLHSADAGPISATSQCRCACVLHVSRSEQCSASRERAQGRTLGFRWCFRRFRNVPAMHARMLASNARPPGSTPTTHNSCSNESMRQYCRAAGQTRCRQKDRRPAAPRPWFFPVHPPRNLSIAGYPHSLLPATLLLFGANNVP